MTLSTGDGVDLAFSVLGGPRRVSDSLFKVWAADRKLTPRAPSLLTLRDQVIAPVLVGIRSLRMGRKPKAWTSIDRHYEQIRVTRRPRSTTWPSRPRRH